MKTVTLPNSNSEIGVLVSELIEGSRNLQSMPIRKRRDLVDACAENVPRVAQEWVASACAAKQIADQQAISAEEILAGPTCLLRYLRLLSRTFQDIELNQTPQLPGKPRRNSLNQICVPILPVKSLFDQMVFWGFKAEVWLQPGTSDVSFFEGTGNENDNSPRVVGVLGAGNVSAIPATDMLYKVFHENAAVLLKLNPVNEYLEPIFERAFQPLVDANLFRMIRGGAEAGNAIVHNEGITSVHITGSHLTHDKIIWGNDAEDRQRRRSARDPLVSKPVTSELGNVTPWIVVPGRYSRRQLQFQADNIVASIVNNGSFNCLATRMVVTSKSWPQRNEFLDLIESRLREVPDRVAYYPGAKERFERATGKPTPDRDDKTLPWTFLQGVSPVDSPQLFQEESFVCVCAEHALDVNRDEDFLPVAVKFVNDELFGTLCASITVPNGFRQRRIDILEPAISQLRYGSVCINQWSGVAYGLMTPPWGGHCSGTIDSPQSGVGHVHNSFFLTNFDKSVLWGPLNSFPKPVWFAGGQNNHQVAWSLFRIYEKPSLLKIPPLLYHAIRR